MEYSLQVEDRLTKELFVLTLNRNGYTLREIGDIMGLGESRVRQIKRKALVRVKCTFRRYLNAKK